MYKGLSQFLHTLTNTYFPFLFFFFFYIILTGHNLQFFYKVMFSLFLPLGKTFSACILRKAFHAVRSTCVTGGVATSIFASPAAGSCSRLPTRLRFTTTRGPRPGVRPASRPAPRRSLARGASGGGAAGVAPTPSASPEGAKWREGVGPAAAAAPRRTMWVNEGRRLPPQRKYGQAPLPH